MTSNSRSRCVPFACASLFWWISLCCEFAHVLVAGDSASALTPRSVPDFCNSPPETGPCRAAFPRWYFNSTTGKCAQFTYGGCQGNNNNFETKKKCIETCKTGGAPQMDDSVQKTIKEYFKLVNNGVQPEKPVPFFPQQHVILRRSTESQNPSKRKPEKVNGDAVPMGMTARDLEPYVTGVGVTSELYDQGGATRSKREVNPPISSSDDSSNEVDTANKSVTTPKIYRSDKTPSKLVDGSNGGEEGARSDENRDDEMSQPPELNHDGDQKPKDIDSLAQVSDSSDETKGKKSVSKQNSGTKSKHQAKSKEFEDQVSAKDAQSSQGRQVKTSEDNDSESDEHSSRSSSRDKVTSNENDDQDSDEGGSLSRQSSQSYPGDEVQSNLNGDQDDNDGEHPVEDTSQSARRDRPEDNERGGLESQEGKIESKESSVSLPDRQDKSSEDVHETSEGELTRQSSVGVQVKPSKDDGDGDDDDDDDDVGPKEDRDSSKQTSLISPGKNEEDRDANESKSQSSPRDQGESSAGEAERSNGGRVFSQQSSISSPGNQGKSNHKDSPDSKNTRNGEQFHEKSKSDQSSNQQTSQSLSSAGGKSNSKKGDGKGDGEGSEKSGGSSEQKPQSSEHDVESNDIGGEDSDEGRDLSRQASQPSRSHKNKKNENALQEEEVDQEDPFVYRSLENHGKESGFLGGYEHTSSHFAAFFLTSIVMVFAAYVVYHNRQKIVAIIIEGRSESGGRRRGYQKLETNVEEAMPSMKSANSTYVY